VQPENPAQFGGKIYEMMGTALSNKFGAPVKAQQQVAQRQGPGTFEAEIVEPAEAGGEK